MKSYHVTCILLQWGRTALHVAAFSEGIQGIHDADFSRGVQAIETLIRSGADVNALDEVS